MVVFFMRMLVGAGAVVMAVFFMRMLVGAGAMTALMISV